MSDIEEKQTLLLSAERDEKILDLLGSQGPLRVHELSTIVDVSEPTIRRDLARLEKAHLVRRMHGGAMLESDSIIEPPVLQRKSLNKEAKKKIGRVAAGLVGDGETVIILGGSTTLEIIPHLLRKSKLTIITDSISIALALANYEIHCILLGGDMHSSELTVEGSLTELSLSQLQVKKAIIGVRAVNFEKGLMLDRLAEIGKFRACFQVAQEVILVADHSKFGSVGTAVLGPLKMVQSVVTNAEIQPNIPAQLRQLGINVYLA
jgi:DeoR family transcriptional regulator, fructose operon transcriptional repressor